MAAGIRIQRLSFLNVDFHFAAFIMDTFASVKNWLISIRTTEKLAPHSGGMTDTCVSVWDWGCDNRQEETLMPEMLTPAVGFTPSFHGNLCPHSFL